MKAVNESPGGPAGGGNGTHPAVLRQRDELRLKLKCFSKGGGMWLGRETKTAKQKQTLFELN